MKKSNENGFSIIEIILAAVIFPIIVVGLYNATMAVNRSYAVARQYNEIYSVLSACPELDRALEFNSITEENNCFPNNVFEIEDGSSGTIEYEPDLTIEDTEDLSSDDDLSDISDAKVITISVDMPHITAPPVDVKLLVARNGLGQQ